MDADDTPLDNLLNELDVPQEFSEYDKITDTQAIIRLEEWKRKAFTVLSDLRARLRDQEQWSLETRAKVVAATATFDGEDPWILDFTRAVAQEILEQVAQPADAQMTELILGRHIKPVFQKNPHPFLNPDTGRRLPKSAGGALAQLDHYEGQVWKRHPGIFNLLSWCIRHVERTTYERIWHLVIPPVMSLLDDYEVPYKLRGVRIVSEILEKVPSGLLKRTGVDGLFFSSLKTCLTYLHNPETPDLLRAVVPASLSLVELTTAPGSAQRFDQLCALLGDGIIGSVWLYATRDAGALQASLDVLPPITHALGIGTARYLKAIIPQLVHPLIPAPENQASVEFQLASACALHCVINDCPPRMFNWKGTILDGVGRCWVTLVESGADDSKARELKRALQDVCASLSDACPSLLEEEFPQMLRLDAMMFAPLLGTQPPPTRPGDR